MSRGLYGVTRWRQVFLCSTGGPTAVRGDKARSPSCICLYMISSHPRQLSVYHHLVLVVLPHSHAHTHTHTGKWEHKHAQTHTCTQTRTPTYIHKHTLKCQHKHAYTHKHPRSHAQTKNHTKTPKLKYTNTHTNTHAHIQTHTHTPTYTCLLIKEDMPPFVKLLIHNIWTQRLPFKCAGSLVRMLRLCSLRGTFN